MMNDKDNIHVDIFVDVYKFCFAILPGWVTFFATRNVVFDNNLEET